MKNKKGRPKIHRIMVNKEHFMRVLKSKNTSIRKLGTKKRNGKFLICNERTIRLGLQKGMNPEIIKRIAMELDVDPKYLSGEVLNYSKDEKIKNHIINNYANKRYPYLDEQWAKTMHNSKELIYGMLPLYDITKEQYIALPKEDKYNFVNDVLVAIRPLIGKYFTEDGEGRPVYSGMMYADNYVNDWIDYEKDEEIIKDLKKEWRKKILPERVVVDYGKKYIKDYTDSEIIDLFYTGYFNK